jgi:hypothetical protein
LSGCHHPTKGQIIADRKDGELCILAGGRLAGHDKWPDLTKDNGWNKQSWRWKSNVNFW